MDAFQIFTLKQQVQKSSAISTGERPYYLRNTLTLRGTKLYYLISMADNKVIRLALKNSILYLKFERHSGKYI